MRKAGPDQHCLTGEVGASLKLSILPCGWGTSQRCVRLKASSRVAIATMVLKSSLSRLDPFTRGQIVGLRQAGLKRDAIAKRVKKRDGASPSVRAVDAVLAKKSSSPSWHGEDSSAGGRPRSLTPAQTKRLVKLVFDERGGAKVTVPYCRKRLPFLRHCSKETVRQELLRAGLAWLRRRRKTSIPSEWKKKRLAYCKWLLRLSTNAMRRFAYTDGTTFYLARGHVDKHDKVRAALGPHVWRMANGKDGLWDENVGPSLYAKAQGLPVKIWGFFSNGMLHYHVLPADGRKTTHMNGVRYVKLVRAKFASWRSLCLPRGGRVSLVQDHEKCLWQPASLKALADAGCDVLERHPKYSPDLNAIDVWWHRLRQLLEDRAPAEIESRPQFILRLRRTVTWMNRRCRQEGKRLCHGQKVRARAACKLKGAKCQY